jgi:hypothetical protein
MWKFIFRGTEAEHMASSIFMSLEFHVCRIHGRRGLYNAEVP